MLGQYAAAEPALQLVRIMSKRLTKCIRICILSGWETKYNTSIARSYSVGSLMSNDIKQVEAEMELEIT